MEKLKFKHSENYSESIRIIEFKSILGSSVCYVYSRKLITIIIVIIIINLAREINFKTKVLKH